MQNVKPRYPGVMPLHSCLERIVLRLNGQHFISGSCGHLSNPVTHQTQANNPYPLKISKIATVKRFHAARD
jgi:hypothetical protein